MNLRSVEGVLHEDILRAMVLMQNVHNHDHPFFLRCKSIRSCFKIMRTPYHKRKSSLHEYWVMPHIFQIILIQPSYNNRSSSRRGNVFTCVCHSVQGYSKEEHFTCPHVPLQPSRGSVHHDLPSFEVGRGHTSISLVR